MHLSNSNDIFRDLMNWCHRIAEDFDFTSSSSSHLVFQEALDCFVACLSKPDKRMPLAEAIGAKLNVTKVKVGLNRQLSSVMGFPTRSDTDQAVQAQKMARNLKFWI